MMTTGKASPLSERARTALREVSRRYDIDHRLLIAREDAEIRKAQAANEWRRAIAIETRRGRKMDDLKAQRALERLRIILSDLGIDSDGEPIGDAP